MSQTNLNIRIDEDMKKQFEAFCSEVGMNVTTAICLYVKTVLREQRIPFEISLDPFYLENKKPNDTTLSAFKEGESMLLDPTAQRFSSVDELFEELNA